MRYFRAKARNVNTSPPGAARQKYTKYRNRRISAFDFLELAWLCPRTRSVSEIAKIAFWKLFQKRDLEKFPKSLQSLRAARAAVDKATHTNAQRWMQCSCSAGGGTSQSSHSKCLVWSYVLFRMSSPGAKGDLRSVRQNDSTVNDVHRFFFAHYSQSNFMIRLGEWSEWFLQRFSLQCFLVSWYLRKCASLFFWVLAE
jgi:hypothetical protein